MALIKLSGLVSNITGKLGGSTFQGSQGGLTLRNISAKKKGQTNQQQFKTSILGMAQRAWRGLTPQLRTAFEVAVTVNPNPKKSASGKRLAAHALFVRVYYYRFINSIQIVPSAVFVDELSIDPAPTIYKVGSSLFLGFLSSWDSSKHFVILNVSAPYQVSRSIQGVSTRLIGLQPTPSNTYDITAQYIQLYGALPLAGQSIISETSFGSQIDNSLAVFKKYVHLI